MKKAFTLIELLLVIAIIALIAAIVFPVLSQARESARSTVCLSNVKQWSTAELMYSVDYDDHLTGYLNYTGSLWNRLVQPYIKNGDVAICPDTNIRDVYNSGNTIYQGGPEQNKLQFSDYGFSVDYLETYTGDWEPSPGFKIALYDGKMPASLPNPSSTLMIVEDQGVNYATNPNTMQPYGNGITWIIPGPNVDAPSIDGASIFFFFGWGDALSMRNYVTASYDWPGFGGVAFRHRGDKYVRGTIPNGHTLCAFVDGHAKSLTVGQLVAGTNWTPTSTHVSVTDQRLYLWNPSD